ncbi:MAG: hypothetical protein IKG69_09045 [Atopobiaceae bacterium]|nr:hypothetical protein [Atopobiaceae bacterium]
MEEVSLEKRTYGADEVASLLGVSRAYAYKIIRRLNAELEAEGRITIPGKVAAAYFEGRFFGEASPKRDGADVG